MGEVESLPPLARRRRPSWLPGLLLALVLSIGFGVWNVSRRRAEQARRDAARIAHARMLGVTNEPLPLHLSREQQAALLVESLDKRIVGRRSSFQEIERTVREIGPIVAAAALQPEVQSGLRRMAQDEGVTLETMRSRWVALQEADLLLEAGGDPDALSPANAAGAAQWLAGTGAGVGLKVNLPESQKLTRQIDELKRLIAWRAYLQRPDSDPTVFGAPAASSPQGGVELPHLRDQLEALRAQRRKADERYDPQKAIFAQSRYLLRLYPKFPGADWLFQAYHGGEGGVTRTLKLYLGSAWPGTTAEAIRHGNGGRPLRYADVYFTSTPQNHVAAFGYLFSRSDDHRHYWWKLLASQDALRRYRQEPAALGVQWESYLPGRPTEALWYAPLIEDSLLSESDATTALNLTAVPADRALLFRPVSPQLKALGYYAALRPEALGTLRLVEGLYRRCGGIGPLTVGDMTYTQAYLQKALLPQPAGATGSTKSPSPVSAPPSWPPDLDRKSLPGGGPPSDFDYHTVGIAFDLIHPTDDHARKILEFALDTLGERKILTWRDLKERGERHYHIVPNPRFGDALRQAATQTPSLPDL